MTAREIPAYDLSVFQKREYDHALVIPVINEGERIRRQLAEIAALALPIDVIVADGGSTDGSLAPDFLRANGVRAVLVKTGRGKLGAQLRMAYAWVLDEGYTGVVTIDGNGKDGLAAIAAFQQKLQEGYDYVQGSRYLPGGAAVNTPLDRHLAGRLVHAPLISLGARRWYTDTTNGFRAYSAKYLLDPRVAPFRNVFESYSLLFYLSLRASQLGYRTIEIPVTRRYPKSTAKTPTKITGFRSRLALLHELIDAVRGKFSPP